MFGKPKPQPESQWQQYEGKAIAELHRGCGRFVTQPHACRLEPPFDPYDRHQVNIWDCVFHTWAADWEGYRVFNPDSPLVLPQVRRTDRNQLTHLAIEQFTDDEATIDKAVQLLLSLPRPRVPIAFELVGYGSQPNFDRPRREQLLRAYQAGDHSEAIVHELAHPTPNGWTDPYTSVQFTAHRDDAAILARQLAAHYPNSAVRELDTFADLLDDLPNYLDSDHEYACSFMLPAAYCFPLNTFSRLDTDPLGPAIVAMEQLDKRHWAVLQVLFTPATHDWAANLYEAIQHPYKPNETLFPDLTAADIDRKAASPLFAVSIRVAASTRPVYEQLLGWANQFANPPQSLSPIDEDDSDDLMPAVKDRCSITAGLLLNTDELASLVHLPAPSVASERLRRIVTRTKAAPKFDDNTSTDPYSVFIGTNVHRGQATTVRIPAKLRLRHCYIAGASGTGKTTLILNMIREDIHAGHGVGLLDPHGDLLAKVLASIPKRRLADVVYFNPTDRQHPPAFNVMDVRHDDPRERERVRLDLTSTLRTIFGDSWGARLEHILSYAFATLVSVPGTTLLDVQRLLTDDQFRRHLLRQLNTQEHAALLAFWNHEFINLPKNACDSILNKLSRFLITDTVHNVLCQPTSSFDFDTIINRKKIFLANLATGDLGRQVAGIFGTFIMSKLVAAAFRRQAVPEVRRRPWFLYVDEFQNFVDLPVSFEDIMAEMRKYRLSCHLANQYVDQLSHSMRAAIFGNVGTLVTFRLGTSDAHLLSREYHIFQPEELMALDVGQAIARAGGSQNAFNLTTPPEPPPETPNHTAAIIAATQACYGGKQPHPPQPTPVTPPQRKPPPSKPKPAVSMTLHPAEPAPPKPVKPKQPKPTPVKEPTHYPTPTDPDDEWV